MDNLLLGMFLIVGVLLIDMVLVLAREAFVNSRLTNLEGYQVDGVPKAALAVRIARESRRLLLSLRAGQNLCRLVTIGLALITFTLPFQLREGANPLHITIVLLGSGLILGLLEFIAENIALRQPERWAIRLSPVVAVIESVLAPIGWLLLRIANRITGGTGDRMYPMVTEEEIMTLVDAGEEEGVIEEEEKAMIYSIFQLANTLAREVMVPRIDMLAFDENTTLIEATDVLLRRGYSRAPVYSGTIDNVIGLLYAKDLLEAWRGAKQDQTVAQLYREAYFVPEAKKVDDLLAEMQAKRVHMAIVVDEYGGTAGLVTIEDVVEEIVGEIQDEYDFAEESAFQKLQEGEFLFSGRIDLDDVNQITGAQLPKETSETLGGFIYSQLGKVPAAGEVVEAGGLRLIVEDVSRRRIRKVRAQRFESPRLEIDENANHNTTKG